VTRHIASSWTVGLRWERGRSQDHQSDVEKGKPSKVVGGTIRGIEDWVRQMEEILSVVLMVAMGYRVDETRSTSIDGRRRDVMTTSDDLNIVSSAKLGHPSGSLKRDMLNGTCDVDCSRQFHSDQSHPPETQVCQSEGEEFPRTWRDTNDHRYHEISFRPTCLAPVHRTRTRPRVIGPQLGTWK